MPAHEACMLPVPCCQLAQLLALGWPVPPCWAAVRASALHITAQDTKPASGKRFRTTQSQRRPKKDEKGSLHCRSLSGCPGSTQNPGGVVAGAPACSADMSGQVNRCKRASALVATPERCTACYQEAEELPVAGYSAVQKMCLAWPETMVNGC